MNNITHPTIHINNVLENVFFIVIIVCIIAIITYFIIILFISMIYVTIAYFGQSLTPNYLFYFDQELNS